MGHFLFTASRIDEGTCAFREVEAQDTFGFEGTFSRLRGGEAAWFTVNGTSREGRWDGQVFEAPYTAARRFEPLDGGADCDSQFTVREDLKVALLSPSQDGVLGNDCPADPSALLQPGGAPLDPDGGVVLPSSTEEGFDAARGCGFLVEDIAPVRACDVQACTLIYRVEGVRKR